MRDRIKPEASDHLREERLFDQVADNGIEPPRHFLPTPDTALS
jgi:hypothetical protein